MHNPITLVCMAYLRIIGLSIVAAVAYGIVHDQITARICVEYFTIGHARIIDSESPTVLDIVWGFVATWWAGLIIGVPLALAARIGGRNKMTARMLLRSIFVLLASMGVAAIAAGVIGHTLAVHGHVRLSGWIASSVPQEKHVAFITALWAHSASYLAGFVGGLVLVIVVIIRRVRAHLPTPEVSLDAPLSDP